MQQAAKQLRTAASKGNVERVRALLEQGLDPNVDARGNSALKLAVANGHIDVVDALLAGGAQLSCEHRGLGLSPAGELLLLACAESSGAIVDRLLSALSADQRAAVLCESDVAGWNVLHLACKAGGTQLVQLALAAGAVIDVVEPVHGATPLMIAVQHARLPIVSALIALSIPGLVQRVDSRGWSALHWAAQLGHLPITLALLAAGAPLEACADGVGTPLMVAAENAHLEIARELLSVGASPDASDGQGWCALAIGASKGYAPIVEELLRAQADVNVSSSASRRTALMAAAQSGHDGVTSQLLAARANVNAADLTGVTALLLATKNGHARLVQMLLAAGARADAADAAGQTALVLNAKSGDVGIAGLLLQHGAQVDHTTRSGVTALALAAKGGHRELIELLMRAGTSHAGELLMRAAASAQMDVLLALIKAGGGLIDTDVLGAALLTAASHGQRSVISVLLNAGASVFKQDASGLSPLMLASANGHVETVRALIKANAPVNAPGGPGANTALSLAARNGRSLVVAELLRHGANVDWRGSGERSLDLLELAHDPAVKAQLVAERQRRNLERELLSAHEEVSARQERQRRKMLKTLDRQAERSLAAAGEAQAAAGEENAAQAAPASPEGERQGHATSTEAVLSPVDARHLSTSPAATPASLPSAGALNFASASGAPAGGAGSDSPLDVAPDAVASAVPGVHAADGTEAGLRRESAGLEPRGHALLGAALATGSGAAPAEAQTEADETQSDAAQTEAGLSAGAARSVLEAEQLAHSEPWASAANVARFCRACNTLALRGHRCRALDVSPAMLAAAGQAGQGDAGSWAEAAEAPWRSSTTAPPPGLGKPDAQRWRSGTALSSAAAAVGSWRAQGLVGEGSDRAADAGSDDASALSLQALSLHTAELAELAREGAHERMLRPSAASRRTQTRVAHAGAAGMQQVIEMQMESIRRLEDQTRLEKQKLRMLLDLQAQLSSLS